jgi:hypothetical protein
MPVMAKLRMFPATKDLKKSRIGANHLSAMITFDEAALTAC